MDFGNVVFPGPDLTEQDNARLRTQTQAIFDLMSDGEWRSLDRIAILTKSPAASVSAQLRHLRKPKFGSHTVNREYMGGGLYVYQLIQQEKTA